MQEVVRYNNDLNKIALTNFTQRDLNFFFTICTQVKNSGTDLVELPFDKIKELSNYQQTDKSKFVEDLKRMGTKVNKTQIFFDSEEEFVTFSLFSYFKVLKTKNIVRVRVNPDFVYIFENVAKMFTRFELAEYVALEGIYAKALFRLLKQWRMNGRTQEYSLSDLKYLLDSPDYNASRFNEYVLNPAIAELNKKGVFKNLEVHIEREKKRGAPVRCYIFHFDKETVSDENKTEKTVPTPKKASAALKKNAFTGYSTQRQYENLDKLILLRQKQELEGLTDEEYREMDRLAKAFIVN